MLFDYLLLVNILSTDNTEEHRSSDTDDETPPLSGHGYRILIVYLLNTCLHVLFIIS